jgi:hypothetical protein
MIRKLALAATIALIPVAALAQGQGSPNGLPDTNGMNPPASKRFQEYVVQQRPMSYSYGQPVVVGTVLPQEGVTYYEVPAEYGVTGQRYTVIDNRTVLVDPRTRRIVQIIQ